MAWEPDFGQKSPVDLVHSGVNAAAGGLREYAAKQAKSEEENRALHPLTQKYFQKVMSGEMTPAEAAVAAHTEIDANQNGIPDSQEQSLPATAPPSYMGGGGPESGDHMTEPAAAGGYGLPTNVAPSMERGVGPDAGQEMDRSLARSSLRTGGMRAASAQPMPQPAMPPLTVRNLPELEAVTRDVQARRPSGITYDQRLGLKDKDVEGKVTVEGVKAKNAEALAGVKATFAEKMQKARLEGRATEVEAQLAQRNSEMWLKYIEHLQDLKNRIEVAEINGRHQEAAALKSQASAFYKANVAGAADITNTLPFLANDPEARGMFGELRSRASSVYGEIAATEVAVPPAAKKGPATSGAKSFKMKFPDPNKPGEFIIHDVSADKVEAAKKKGGELTGG